MAALACPGDPSAPVAVPAEALRKLAEAVDGLAESVRLSQEDVSQQIRSGKSPDFDGAYHLVWCRAMRAVVMADPLVDLWRSLQDHRSFPDPVCTRARGSVSR